MSRTALLKGKLSKAVGTAASRSRRRKEPQSTKRSPISDTRAHSARPGGAVRTRSDEVEGEFAAPNPCRDETPDRGSAPI